MFLMHGHSLFFLGGPIFTETNDIKKRSTYQRHSDSPVLLGVLYGILLWYLEVFWVSPVLPLLTETKIAAHRWPQGSNIHFLSPTSTNWRPFSNLKLRHCPTFHGYDPDYNFHLLKVAESLPTRQGSVGSWYLDGQRPSDGQSRLTSHHRLSASVPLTGGPHVGDMAWWCMINAKKILKGGGWKGVASGGNSVLLWHLWLGDILQWLYIRYTWI